MRRTEATGAGVRPYLELCKLRVSLLASATALAGAVLVSPRLSGRLLLPWLGVLILACGASALNQAQEWKIDSRMERTRQRPVPSGVIPRARAFGCAAFLTVLGLVILAAADLRAAILGFFAVAWYNGAYTRLKRVSAWAAVPGALTGAIPPAVGWAGAGGSLADPRLLMACLLIFIWQVPHFWLLLLDRGREYTRAGLPALTDFLSESQIRAMVSLWITGTGACALLVSLSRLVYTPGARYALLAVSLWLSYQGIRFGLQPARAGQKLFRMLNLFLVLVLLVLCLSRLSVQRRQAGAQAWTSAAMAPAAAPLK
jgi:heme o synthase